MTKLLYIIGNSKSEEVSSSRTVSRALVDAIAGGLSEVTVEEINLYEDRMPRIKGEYYEGKNAVIKSEARKSFTKTAQQEIAKIEALCDQFVAADIYVLAAPVWSMSFPAPVKEYLDCVVQTGKTISFENKKPQGLLCDKERVFIYVQSSGGKIPKLLKPALAKGLCYTKELMKLIGIEKFEELLIEGTGETEEERQEAIMKAMEKIPAIVNKLL